MRDDGFIFTMDAVLALIPVFVILASVSTLTVSDTVLFQRHSMVINHVADDSMASLDKLGTLDEMATMYANYTWLNSSDNPNQNTTTANSELQRLIDLINDTFEPLIPSDFGYRVRLGNEIIVDGGGSNGRPTYANASGVAASSRIASGFGVEQPVLGCVANAYLEKIVAKTTTKIVPMNLGWGGYNGQKGYLEKQFELPNDTTVISARMYYAPDTSGNQFYIYINGNDILDGSETINYVRDDFTTGSAAAHAGAGGYVYDVNVPVGYLQAGVNNMTFAWTGVAPSMSHIHPGNWLEINYSTADPEAEVQGQEFFYGTRVIGQPGANQIIPFIVDGDITNIFAHVKLIGVENFVLITGNYNYEDSNPTENVILYRMLNSTTGVIPSGNWLVSSPADGETIEYNITVTSTETIITESLNGGSVKTLINSNVNLSNFFNDKSNMFAIYTDIDAPNNATGSACSVNVADWEVLGQYYYGDPSSFVQETDDNPNGNAEIFSDEFGDPGDSTYVKVTYTPRVSIGYNFISVGQTFDFPGASDNGVCQIPAQNPMTQVSFTTPSYDPIEVQLFGSQFWGGCDNGYNTVWVDGSIVMDTDTPPGTSTFLPPKSFSSGSTIQLNVSDKDPNRYLVCGDRSKIFYNYRVPSQVDFGDTYDKCAGSNQQFYYDGDQDGTQDGTITPSVGSSPDGYDPCTDGIDDALWRLLDVLNFIGDNVDGGDACDDATVLTNVTSDGNQTNPFDLEIDPTEIRFAGTSLGSIPNMGGPLEIRFEVWGE